jgi:hypothetical protein
MKRSVATALLKVAAILLFLDLAMTSERYSEANRATGAIRTRTTRALVFKGGWKEKPTWLSERAKELGLNSDHQWQYLGRRTTTHFIWVSRGSGKTPASFPIRYLDPEDLSQEQQDQFVARFVQGTEKEREDLIRQIADGSFPGL